ncbi:MAG: M3 family oligoendopeptidase, partial [Candidatus Krumholzibacteriota bacterium]|nr:M3 family oligoendopeptidase [Candidatus Krumholzibacteriota bacterium]
APARKKPAAKLPLWDLTELYSGKDDPKIEKDLRALERACKRFAADYRGRVGFLNADGLARALADREAIETITYRLFIHAQLQFATKSNDPAWGAFQQMIQERHTMASVHLEFFPVEWTQVSDARASELAAHPDLARYRHYLEHLRLHAPHTLTEPEEVLASKLSQVGGSAWVRYYNSVLADIGYLFRGRKLTSAELTAKFQDPDRSVRRDAHKARAAALIANRKPLTYAFNMVLADSMVGDEVRHYDHWVQRRNLANEIPDKVVGALVKAVHGRADILQRYLRLKRRLLKVPTLMSYDVWAPLPGARQPRADYAHSVDLVRTLFTETRPSFGRVAGKLFDKRHVDVPPYPGKRAGAFCMPNMQGLPYVLMNWTGKLRDTATLAHEFGHAVHMELSRDKGPLGVVESLVMAEVASVFMETLLYQRLLAETPSPRARLDLLRQIIEDGLATTFRQMQFNRFEAAVHNHRREKGELTHADIAAHFAECDAAFYGDTVKPAKDADNFWMYITHFVNVPGYVYAYCASYLVVLALYRRYMEVGPSFLDGYEAMLAAGGSRTPEELLAELGVDWSRATFWKGGLAVLESYVDQFESTAEELKLI